MFKKLFISLLIISPGLGQNRLAAQCTNAIMKWDYLDYLSIQGASNANYLTYISTPALYTSMVQTQSFAIGVNRVTIGTNFTSANLLGENATHTGETGSYGTGDDVNYTGNGIITLTFDSLVSNVKLSLYDVDASARTQLSALNGSGTSINVTLSSAVGAWASSVFVATPATTSNTSVGLTPRVDATLITKNQGNTGNKATLNVDVAGPVKSITITVSNNTSNPEFWLSDIQACITGSFPTNYYYVSKPFTGQPSYVLAVHDLNTVYMVDPATGRAVSLFTDNSPRVREINDLAYDPYKRILYYSIDGLERCTPAGNTDSVRYIKKYDFNTETISQVINDVNSAPFNIPTYSYGLESSSAAFYNGSLYQGVEAVKSGSTNMLREATVWRVDFAADSITPIKSCQVYAMPADDGTSLIHDWGDITIKDGVLYDFNATSSSSFGNYNTLDLQTRTLATYPGLSLKDKPRQVAQQWDGGFCWIHDSVAIYNGTNILSSPKQKIVAAAGSVPWVAGAGDAAESFVPKVDFGDAPASYDPVPASRAVNEKDSAIHIGAGYSWEWAKKTSSTASGDDYDDGIVFVPIFDPATKAYMAQVNVYNNKGADATLIAWLDFNGNGVFDASEGMTPITVSSSTSLQTFNLYWFPIVSSLPNGSYTYLRVRLTSASNGMTTSNATGYFNDGETEDYRLIVDNFPLSVNLLSWDAAAFGNTTARLTWNASAEMNVSGYGLERSADGINWNNIGFVNAKGNGISSDQHYLFDDKQALKGKSFYRLKLVNKNNTSVYTELRTVTLKSTDELVKLMPNPAVSSTKLYINSDINAESAVSIYDMQGRKIREENYRLLAGVNYLTISNLDKLPAGTYLVQVQAGQMNTMKKLLIGKTF